MRKNILLLCLALLGAAQAWAQQKFTVSGTVKDQSSGEILIGALVRAGASGGAYANEYGFYSITLPAGTYRIVANYIGYDTLSQEIVLDQNRRIDFDLPPQDYGLEDVVITDEKADENVTQSTMGLLRLDMEELKKVPVIFGERDPLKTLQLMPGVKSTGEGNGGLYVRGGEASQNLILLDEAPVYNAYHLLGFFSTFNADAINDLALYKGTAPAQYGGRLSSVIDVKMNEGNNQDYHVSGGVGLIASHLNVEGPIVKDKGSFLLTGRRTYADLFLQLSGDENIRNSQLYFYDINGKANYTINDKNRIYLSGYHGRDRLGLAAFGINWGNTTGTLRWNHIINGKWFSNTSFIFSDYAYEAGIENDVVQFNIASGIRDYNFKQEFQYFASPKHSLRMGLNAIHHTVTPGQITFGDTASFQPAKVQDRASIEGGIYLAGEYQPATRLRISYGLRLSAFTALGGGDFYTYDPEGNVTDTTAYDDFANVQSYVQPEPRLSLSYTLGANNSLKAAYTRNAQYMHMVSNATSAAPTDVWLSSSQNIAPELSDQISLGYFHNFDDDKYELSVEGYYKQLYNQLDLRNGADIQANEFLEGELLSGDGRAYGLEFFLKKKRGQFTGWVSYTLSRTERQIDGINNDDWYAARQDATHDLSLVGIYDLSKSWNVAATWVYRTGNAVTFPTGKYIIDGQTQFYYTERNGYRMPAYHRLDLSATYTRKKSERFESSWNFACYNAYGRENAFSIDFREDPDDPTRTQAVKTALFKWVPSVTYNFKF